MKIYKVAWQLEESAWHKPMYRAYVFAVGKWRPQYPVCRKPRKFTRKEIATMQKTIWVNTGKQVSLEEIGFEFVN